MPILLILQGWLHPGLSVLMNVTHNNEAGREAVAAGGGLEALAQLVVCCAAPALQTGAGLASPPAAAMRRI